MNRIKTFQLDMPFGLGRVNCYLVQNENGCFLIDSGSPNRRKQLESELEQAGCRPGALKLIILTHGDFDHAGNAAYLAQKFDAPVAMHPDDRDMVEQGDMFANRNRPNILIRKLIPLLSGFGKKERFRPDMFIDEGDDFAGLGLDAQVLSIPGHSRGSIGILLPGGELFCGDLFSNLKEAAFNSLMDDLDAAHASLEKLKGLEITTVYPGHGEPFQFEQFLKTG